MNWLTASRLTRDTIGVLSSALAGVERRIGDQHNCPGCTDARTWCPSCADLYAQLMTLSQATVEISQAGSDADVAVIYTKAVNRAAGLAFAGVSV